MLASSANPAQMKASRGGGAADEPDPSSHAGKRRNLLPLPRPAKALPMTHARLANMMAAERACRRAPPTSGANGANGNSNSANEPSNDRTMLIRRERLPHASTERNNR